MPPAALEAELCSQRNRANRVVTRIADGFASCCLSAPSPRLCAAAALLSLPAQANTTTALFIALAHRTTATPNGTSLDDNNHGRTIRAARIHPLCLQRVPTATNASKLAAVEHAERPKCFAVDDKLAGSFLHCVTIAQRSVRLHASITCSGLGKDHRAMSPENPRVMMLSPSTRTPMR